MKTHCVCLDIVLSYIYVDMCPIPSVLVDNEEILYPGVVFIHGAFILEA